MLLYFFSEIIVHIGQFLDTKSLLALYRTCRAFKELIDQNIWVNLTFYSVIKLKLKSEYYGFFVDTGVFVLLLEGSKLCNLDAIFV